MSPQNVQGEFSLFTSAENFINVAEDQGGIRFDQQSFSLGKGVNFGGRIGYRFQKSCGVEMEVSYLQGAILRTENFSKRSIHSNMLRLVPKIVMSVGHSCHSERSEASTKCSRTPLNTE